MKLQIPLALALLLTVAAVPLSSGCKTWNQDKQEQIAYKTLSSIAITVDAMLKSYADAYVSKVIPADQHDRIVRMHEKYRISMATAIAASKMNLNSIAPDEVVNLAEALVILIKEVL